VVDNHLRGLSFRSFRFRLLPETFFLRSRILLFTVLLVCFGLSTEATATKAKRRTGPKFIITQPSSNSIIRGESMFAVSTTDRAVVSVEFDFGSKRFGIATSPPFEIVWNTGYASDGSYALQAIGRNKQGLGIESTELIVTVDNKGDSIAVTSPTLSTPLQGRVTLSITGADRQASPILWIVSIDGSTVGVAWTVSTLLSNSATIPVDTTRFLNGHS